MNAHIFSTFEQTARHVHQLSQDGKRIVLAGGVFDILHVGHVRFLEQAKKAGDILCVALEPDEKVRQIKGPGRPINDAQTRAYVLSALTWVDCVFILPYFTTDDDYRQFTLKLSPAIIAVTQGDPYQRQKQQYAKDCGGKILVVTPKLPVRSTTELIKLLSLE